MQQSLALKHLSGSKANEVDRLVLPPEREITFGRDPSCHVRYDESDDLVSRKHLKIVASNEQPVRYMVIDLGSRNGTFVNRQKVFGAVLLSPGGRVQLGAGGPEFEFSLENPQHETRASKPARGRTPVRKRIFGAVAILVLLLAGAVLATHFAVLPQVTRIWHEWRRTHAAAPDLGSGFDAAAARAAVTRVEARWSIYDKQTGATVARAYVPNQRISQGTRVPLVEGAPAKLPAFVLGEDHRIKPLLVAVGNAAAGERLGGSWVSKGVFVSAAGDVLSAQPVQRPWGSTYRWPAEESAGALLVLESSNVAQVAPLAASQFPQWVATGASFLAEGLPSDLEGTVRGRWVSGDDLAVAVTGTTSSAGDQTSDVKMVSAHAGIWLAKAESSATPGGVPQPLFETGNAPMHGEDVWVIGDTVEEAKISSAPAGGLLKVQARDACNGAVVFNKQGRVVALCVPDADSSGAGTAIPIGLGLGLLKGTTADDHPRQP